MEVRFARQVSFVCVAVAGLLLPACTQSPPPAPPSSTSPTPIPIATTSPTSAGAPSTTTTAATDEQLAIKAVERYYEELNKAVVSLSTKEFRTTYKPGCEPCDQTANKIDSIALAGRRLEGGKIAVSGIHLDGRPNNPRVLTLEGIVKSEPIAVRDSSGKIVESDNGTAGPKFFIAFNSGAGWIISGLGDA
jgi:hypothetical protein